MEGGYEGVIGRGGGGGLQASHSSGQPANNKHGIRANKVEGGWKGDRRV